MSDRWRAPAAGRGDDSSSTRRSPPGSSARRRAGLRVAQQHDTGEVLMVAWMDDEALHRTLTTGRATYWSRSRQEYWVKGESSGHAQRVRGPAGLRRRHRAGARRPGRRGLPHRRPDLLRRRRAARRDRLSDPASAGAALTPAPPGRPDSHPLRAARTHRRPLVPTSRAVCQPSAMGATHPPPTSHTGSPAVTRASPARRSPARSRRQPERAASSPTRGASATWAAPPRRASGPGRRTSRHAAYSSSPPVSSRSDACVASPSGRSTSSPPAFPSRSHGVYDAVDRGRSSTPRSRSRNSCCGIRLTTSEYRGSSAGRPANEVADTAAPPVRASRSRTRTDLPARAR